MYIEDKIVWGAVAFVVLGVIGFGFLAIWAAENDRKACAAVGGHLVSRSGSGVGVGVGSGGSVSVVPVTTTVTFCLSPDGRILGV